MTARMFIQRRPHIPNPRWPGSHSALSQSAVPAPTPERRLPASLYRSSMVRGARRLPKDLVDCAQSRQRHDIANDDGALSLDGPFGFQQSERGVDLGTAGADEQGQLAL